MYTSTLGSPANLEKSSINISLSREGGSKFMRPYQVNKEFTKSMAPAVLSPLLLVHALIVLFL